MQPSLRNYLRECFRQAPHSWRKGAVVMTLLISGGIFVGLFLGWHLNAYPTSYFLGGTALIAAFDVFAILPFQLWKTDQQRIAELETHLTPRLRCTFGMGLIGCYRPNTPLMDPRAPTQKTVGTWFRIKTESTAAMPQTGCHGRLISIKRGETEMLAGESPLLPFAPHEADDALSKTLYPNVPEYLDLLALIHGQVLLVLRGQLSNAVQWGDIFSLPGGKLQVVVVSDNSTSPPIEILFHWTLDPVTSRLEQKSIPA